MFTTFTLAEIKIDSGIQKNLSNDAEMCSDLELATAKHKSKVFLITQSTAKNN